MKAKRNRTIYEVYNLNDELIARGVSEDVAQVIGCKRNSVCSSMDGKRMFGKYLIKSIGKKIVEIDVDVPDKENVKEKNRKEILESNLRNLERNGNTIVMKDIDWHLDYFREHGFDCKARKVTHINKRRRKECYYIVEVNNARA